MNKLFFILVFIFYYSFCFSQSATSKYNSIYNRYEYFDSNGTMTGYKTYNSVSQQWEYYEIPKTNTQNRYNEVQQVDTDYRIKSLQYAENKSSRNYKKVEDEIKSFISSIDEKIADIELRKACHSNFKQCVDELNNKKVDFSSDVMTNNAINYLFSCWKSSIENAREKIDNERTEREKNTVLEFMKYNGGYKVPIIKEYVLENGQYKLIKTETSNDNYFYYDGNVIYFKRGISSLWLNRELTFKMFNSYLNVYSYSSIYGSVFIDKDFKILTLVDDVQNGNNVTIKKYEYLIGDYDKNIKPYN